jgi:XRE family aerobic/anaerobic benzoate catabolism transcriptional regulator
MHESGLSLGEYRLNDQVPVDEFAAALESGVKNPLLISFGERLRTLRARRGLTRKAVAQAAEVSERYLANLEHGTRQPPRPSG